MTKNKKKKNIKKNEEKKMKKKNESAISKQTYVQRKMNARGSFETTVFFFFFFFFSLILEKLVNMWNLGNFVKIDILQITA